MGAPDAKCGNQAERHLGGEQRREGATLCSSHVPRQPHAEQLRPTVIFPTTICLLVTTSGVLLAHTAFLCLRKVLSYGSPSSVSLGCLSLPFLCFQSSQRGRAELQCSTLSPHQSSLKVNTVNKSPLPLDICYFEQNRCSVKASGRTGPAGPW